MPPPATLDLDATLVIVDLDATLVIANSHQVIAGGYQAFRRHQIMLPRTVAEDEKPRAVFERATRLALGVRRRASGLRAYPQQPGQS